MPNSYDPLIAKLSQKAGTDPEHLKRAMQNGSADEMLKKLDPSQQQKIRSLLNNKTELERIMRSDAAQAILKKLSEGR